MKGLLFTLVIIAIISAVALYYFRIARSHQSALPTDMSQLHVPCPARNCSVGLKCLSYYGIAGASGPLFTSCEIPCTNNFDCPGSLTCSTIADGPGKVCN